MNYAKKVQKDKGSTFLSLREQKNAEKAYGRFEDDKKEVKLSTGKPKDYTCIIWIDFPCNDYWIYSLG